MTDHSRFCGQNVSSSHRAQRRSLGFLVVFSFALQWRVPAAELNPAAMPEVGHHQLRILDDTLLELTLITTKDPDPAPPTVWNFVGPNYSLNLPPASEFEIRVGSNIASIAEIGFKRRPLYAPLKRRDLRIENSLYLRLVSPIPEGETVVVRNPSTELWPTNILFRAIADPRRFNPAIHVNQVGYAPNATKKAMVGYYLGSLGEMLIAASSFSVIKASSGEIVFSGALVRRPDSGFVYSPPPYQQVFEADFSPLNTAGEYKLLVPKLGVSFPFFIEAGAPAAFARTLTLGLYHQRCAARNELPFTRHEHGICHAAPAEIPTMVHQAVNQQLAAMSADYASNPRHTAPQLKDVDSSLYPFVRQGTVDVSLGHHDAGDYSKYTINSAALIHHLVFAADAFPGASALDNLGIPESGDGKPDLLQEAKWEADFLSKMQDTDGGFYFLVYPRDRPYEEDVLPNQGDPQVVFPKNTAATAAAVAALAEIASSPEFKQHFPGEAAGFLEKAHLGWRFLTNAIATFGKDGSYQKISHYGNEFMHDDELGWAAAAMFAATGEPSFHQRLIEWYAPDDPKTRRWTWWRLFEGYGCAARTYAFAARTGRLPAAQLNSAFLGKAEAEILAAADDIARFAEENAYGTSFPTPNKRQRSAGWFFSTERAFELAVAQVIAPQSRYLKALQSNVNYEAGCNPVNMPYISGLGWRRWREIVHQYAQNDHRVLPPSGLPLGNIQAGFSWLENYKHELGALCYPPDGAESAPYPFYDRWGDAFNTTTEATVMDQARSLAVAAFSMAQSAMTNAAAVRTIGVISGLPSTAPAGQPITATLQANGVDLSRARVVWEARDQEPFIGHVFSFAAKNPGEQWVEVEAQLPDGNRVFGRAVFNATAAESIPPNPYQSAPLMVTPDLIALYHLDDLLTDATGRNAPLTLSGNARLDSLNLSWMANRAGGALRVHDLGDKAIVTIPAAALYSANSEEITLEAMIYINAFKAWNRSSVNLLSLRKAWNANIELIDDIYSGPHIRGGTQFDVNGASVASALPLRTWFHLGITISRSGYSARVNGQLLAQASSAELANWNGGSAVLEIGNFDGWVDEVVLRNARPANSTLPPPTGGTAQATSPMAIQLAWRDNSTNESGFRIYRALNPTDFVEVATTSPDATNYTDSGLASDTTYYYAITAFNEVEESEPLTLSAATASQPQIPAAPSDLTATAISRSRINLSWKDQSTNETNFEIERSLDGANYSRIATAETDTTSYADRNLQAGTRYYYRVRALNAAGASAYSNQTSARTRLIL